jgi:zinc transport system substrate-binding protein
MSPRLPPITDEEQKLQITASFYPLAFFAKTIGGDQVQVSTLIPQNSDVHSWQPSISDITDTEESDLIIYLGAGLDHWMEHDILETINITGKIILEASEGIELIEIHEEEHEEHEEEEEGHEHEEGDPHLWVSPYTGYMIAENIYNAIIDVDPDNSEYYKETWEELEQTLLNLDQRYQSELAPAAGKTFFTTHSAYGYIEDRYGLEQHGIIGISADEQPSTMKLAEMVDEMEEENSFAIFVDPIYSREYAETLKSELSARTGEQVDILDLYLMLGSMDDLDYLGQLEVNLENLKTGLIE